jgi:glycosyltransferase involved in cell wall biosynthesis
MRICVVADGQSPHSQNWIKILNELNFEVHLISTYPFEDHDLKLASCQVLPIDITAKARAKEKHYSMGTSKTAKRSYLSKLRGSKLWDTLAELRTNIAPVMVKFQAPRLARLIEKIDPDVVHAMRIPFEGMVAARALEGSERWLVISTWGNDFSLFAPKSKTLGDLTRKAVRRANALHSDCLKDLENAFNFGLCRAAVTLVAPGNGGVNTEVFRPTPDKATLRKLLSLPEDAPILINPRGVKQHVRNDTVFQSLPAVVEKFPNVLLLCPAMEGSAWAKEQVSNLDLTHNVQLLPSLSQSHLAQLMAASDVLVSIADHDGTPNSMLEAIETGCIPVVADIESSHEWIVHGENGFIVNPGSPEQLSEVLIDILSDPTSWKGIIEKNALSVSPRSQRPATIRRVLNFYRDCRYTK